jgi:formamidopyrimidine-DNA glycosylase
MPELPEVQTILNDLENQGLIGQIIKQVHVYWPKTVATPELATFISTLHNKTIQGLSRRGKFLIFHLSDNYELLIHLRMTGRLLLSTQQAPLSPYIRLSLDLTRHHLLFHDTRKFGRWYLVRQSQNILHKMGPEPLDPNFSLNLFTSLLKKRQRALKPLLLDQTFIAGLGNIYVDEALWEAKLHPLQPAKSLTKGKAAALYQAIKYVLQRGIDSQGTTLGAGRTNFYRLDGKKGSHQNLLKVFRRTGQPCSRCGHLIERLIVAQRSTHICPFCQNSSLFKHRDDH